MGLDLVHLVMEVEDRFNIHLPDAECGRVRTVADFAALVIARLPTVDDVCPTAHAFYEFRRLLVSQASIPRNTIRPSTRLDVLLHRDRRAIWNGLRGHCRRLPRLVATPRTAAVTRNAGVALACIWLAGVAALWGVLGAPVALLLSLVILIAGVTLFFRFAGWFERYFPPGLETVGDISRVLAPAYLPQNPADARLTAQQQVLEEVRRITADALGLPLEKVQANSEFVKDLGAS